MLNTLSGEILCVKCHLLISSLAALHIPLVNTVAVEERGRMDVTNSFIIQTPVCLKRDNRTAVEKAVVTNEGLWQ